MKRSKIVASSLALLLALPSIPAAGKALITSKSDPATFKSSAVLRRYSIISDWDCILDAYENEVSVLAWVRFEKGTRCSLTVHLYRNGKEIRTWATSSTKGYVSINETIDNMPAGTYEAIMEFKAGSDTGSERSGERSL